MAKPKAPKPAACSNVDLRLFADKCIDAHSVWQFYKTFSNYEWSIEVAPALELIGNVLHQHSILQICKLFDPKENGRQNNLSVHHIIHGCIWTDQTLNTLTCLAAEMKSFIAKVAPARHKIIAHNDLEVHRRFEDQGGFSAGEDDTFFEKMHSFLDCAYWEKFNGPFPDFPPHTITDVYILAKALGLKVRRII